MAKDPRQQPQKRVILKYTLILVGLMIALVLGREIFLYLYPEYRITYQQFKPTKLPAGLAIEDRYIGVWSKPLLPIPDDLTYTTVNVGFDFNRADSHIIESKSAFDYKCYSNITNQTCTIKTTPQGQRYQQTTTYSTADAKKPSNDQVTLTKDGTKIDIQISPIDNKTFSEDDWNILIDSMESFKIGHIKINRYHPGP